MSRVFLEAIFPETVKIYLGENRPAKLNEIDLVVVNEIDGQAQIVELKRKYENIDLDILRDKGVQFLRATGEQKNYQITYLGLSMDEM